MNDYLKKKAELLKARLQMTILARVGKVLRVLFGIVCKDDV